MDRRQRSGNTPNVCQWWNNERSAHRAMSALQELEELGMHIGWRTALLGWVGPAENAPQVDGREIVELAVVRLTQVSETGGDVLELASMTGYETEEIGVLLRRLAQQEGSSEALELRKWRFLLLSKLLAALPEDPLYAWIALSELWKSFGHPSDSPEIIRTFEKTPSSERYTPEMRQRLLSDHRQWLSTERTAIAHLA